MQQDAPIYEALKKFKNSRVIPFDVPGHKRGAANPQLREFLGKDCLDVDVNSMCPLDNLTHPVSVIKQAEEIAAQAFGANHTFFMVGGTTSSVQAMILSVCKQGDQIILPRNVHRSVLNALVLCGAVPIYLSCEISQHLGIAVSGTLEQVKKTIEKHPQAKAIVLNNPTYYGICSDLRAIVALAHQHHIMVLVDEAHGAHFYFGDHLPVSAMQAGADMASVSMHKSGGSLTQSSFLLCGERVNKNYVRKIINLTQTTSASYLLLSSLDISRRYLALQGRKILAHVCDLAEYAREEINQIGDYYAFSKELIDHQTVYDFDITKLAINTTDLGLAGIEVYDLLRDEYDIQIEFGDVGNILAYISVGDCKKNVEMLIGALSEIRRRYKRQKVGMIKHEYFTPIVQMTPQKAFYAEKESVQIEKSCGRICTEFLMSYPPGIPIIAPGEEITPEIIEYILYAKEKGCCLTGPEDMQIDYLNVMKGES